MGFAPIQINIRSMDINSTDHSSTVSFGSTCNINRNVAGKKNQGIGQQFADSTFCSSTVSMVLDDDILDRSREKNNKP